MKKAICLGFILFVLLAHAKTDGENMSDGNYLLGSCQITIRNADNRDYVEQA